MKSIEKIYDEISPVSYDEDRLAIYSGSRKVVTEQLKRASSQPSRIADLAVGTGES